MKTIGLIGGTSWPSTILYYEKLNRAAQESLGGHHSARLLLYSIDYHLIKSLYNNGWDKIPSLLAEEIQFFMEKKPDCLVLCNNTLHRALDEISAELDLQVPIFHAGHLAADEAQRQGAKNVLLLATAFTMEDGFFAHYFEERGIRVIVPSSEDRRQIQAIQTRLAAGKSDSTYGTTMAEIVGHYPQAEAVVLACTELPLALKPEHISIPVINTIVCQCNAAASFAFPPQTPVRHDLLKNGRVAGVENV